MFPWRLLQAVRTVKEWSQLNRDRSYYRRQRMRVIHRKENILRQLGGEENVLAWEHGAAGRLSKGKIHCSCWMCRSKSYDDPQVRDKRRRSMPPSSCWRSSNFSHKKRFPAGGGQISAALGQEAFLTLYLITVRVETLRNGALRGPKKIWYLWQMNNITESKK